MDLERLSLHPQEIDKNTGRIILPKTRDELDHLASLPPHQASQPRAPQRNNGMGQMAAQVSQRAETTAHMASSREHPAPPAYSPSGQPMGYESRSGISLGPGAILGFCLMIALLPLFIVSSQLRTENERLQGQVNSLTTRLDQVTLGNRTSDREVAGLKGEIQALSGFLNDIYRYDDEVYDQGLAPAGQDVVDIIEVDENGQPFDQQPTQ